MTKKIVCITGATSGIGRATAISCLRDDYFVVGVGLTPEHIDETLSRVPKEQRNSLMLLKGDVGNREFTESLAKEIRKVEGKLVGLVNSAGTINSGGILDCPPEEWQRILNVNLSSIFLVSRALVPLMLDGGSGSIVNISSVCALRPCASVAYSVSKAGTDMLTKCMAKDLAPKRIRVNSVNPGVVRTNLQTTAKIVDDYEGWINKMMPLHPLGRVGTVDDIIPIITYLLSEQSSWTTGAIISVDGGRAL